MNLHKHWLLLLLLTNVIGTGNLTGQSNFELNFQGRLIDIQGNGICNEPFDLSVQIIRPTGHEVLYEMSSSPSSDKEGWFGFAISEITQYLIEDGILKSPVVIKMEFRPNKLTKWMRKGEEFMVTYTLKPVRDSTDTHLIMTRMEGSELMIYTEDNFYAFKDQIPFGYLLGGFILTDLLPADDQELANLRQWLNPDHQQKEVSRGVKGGFPAGGYYRKK